MLKQSCKPLLPVSRMDVSPHQTQTCLQWPVLPNQTHSRQTLLAGPALISCLGLLLHPDPCRSTVEFAFYKATMLTCSPQTSLDAADQCRSILHTVFYRPKMLTCSAHASMAAADPCRSILQSAFYKIMVKDAVLMVKDAVLIPQWMQQIPAEAFHNVPSTILRG